MNSNRLMCESACKKESACGECILQGAQNMTEVADLVKHNHDSKERVDTSVFLGSPSKVAEHIRYTTI